MDETELQASVELYQSQLEQVEAALSVTPAGEAQADLIKLKGDLQQLLDLTNESLLSLKKSKLLSMLDGGPQPSSGDGSGHGNPGGASEQLSEMDREFLAFQAEIADVSGPSEPSAPPEESDESRSRSLSPEMPDEDLNFDDIAGTKCRVAYHTDWGPTTWHNAMIFCAEPVVSEEAPVVRVLFCNPTERALQPCPYFLEGKCKFSSEDCRYSHGYRVNVIDLQEFQEPDYSSLKLCSRCQAKYYGDGLWYEGKIVDVLDDHKFKVMFDDYDNTETVDLEDILPLDEDGSELSDIDHQRQVDSEDEDLDLHVARSDEEDEEDEVPVFLWRPPQTTDALGEWEKHTKGIGSRLMRKMGYIIGQGLGKNGEGRAEPVPIQLLPSGKSLDKIMELKEQAGDKDLYDIMKKRKHKQKKIDDKAAKDYQMPKGLNVFEVINKKLGGKKGDIHSLARNIVGKKNEKHHISESDLKSRSDKHLNIQLLKTHEELKNVDREIRGIEASLKRNNGRDPGVTAKFNEKLASMQAYRKQLSTSAASIEKHQFTRKDHKKMSIF